MIVSQNAVHVTLGLQHQIIVPGCRHFRRVQVEWRSTRDARPKSVLCAALQALRNAGTAMKVTLTVTDNADGTVDIVCDSPAPPLNEPCEISRCVAWYMAYAAEKLLLKSPVRKMFYRSKYWEPTSPRVAAEIACDEAAHPDPTNPFHNIRLPRDAGTCGDTPKAKG